MVNRWLFATMLSGALSTACDLPTPPPPPNPEQQAATKAREEAEARFRQYVAEKHYLSAANAVLNDHLYEGQARTGRIRRLLDSHAGSIEGAEPLLRFQGYGSLARVAKRAELPDDVVK